MRIVRLAGVPDLFEPLQGLDDHEGLLNRVRPGSKGARGVLGIAVDLHLEPDRANLRAQKLRLERLRDERRLGAIAASQTRQRAVAGALLLDHRLEKNLGRGLHAEAFESLERIETRRQSGLHIAGSASVHPAVPDRRFVRITCPVLARSGGNDVDVTVENERTPFGDAWRIPCDDIVGVVI
jgi:hypothetical protein